MQLDSLSVGEQVLFSLCVPQVIVGLAQAVQFREHGIGLAQLLKVSDGSQRQVDVVVDQLLAAGDLGQVQNGVNYAVQTANMGDHGCGVDLALVHHLDGFSQVVIVAAGGAHHMGVQVVNIVPVEVGLELRVGGACEEVQAAIVAQNTVGLLNQRLNGGEADDIVIAGAAGQGPQVLGSTLHTGVDVVQFLAATLSLFHGVDGSSTSQASLVDIGDLL